MDRECNCKQCSNLPNDIRRLHRKETEWDAKQRQRQGIGEYLVRAPIHAIGIVPGEILGFVVWILAVEDHATCQPEEGEIGVGHIEPEADLNAGEDQYPEKGKSDQNAEWSWNGNFHKV